jgi:hypothetical protein
MSIVETRALAPSTAGNGSNTSQAEDIRFYRLELRSVNTCVPSFGVPDNGLLDAYHGLLNAEDDDDRAVHTALLSASIERWRNEES